MLTGCNPSVLVGKNADWAAAASPTIAAGYFLLDKKRRLQYCDPSSTGGNTYGSAHS
jgi:hypothetical protein